MSAWIEHCNMKTSLSHVQIEHLRKISACIPFVADLVRARLRLYVPALREGSYSLVEDVCPSTVIPVAGESVQETEEYRPDEPLVRETFCGGTSLTQWRETATGTTGVRTCPLKDFSEKCIAVVSLSFQLVRPMEEYAHLLYGAEMVLLHGGRNDPAMYRRLTTEDGILIADRFHRIVFADEIVLHIYRALGVGSLLGRNVKDPCLMRGIDREIVAREFPWEREMQAGDRSLKERRLDFSEGGNALGTIMVLSDITELRRREQEAKIQEALIQRIEALEDELLHLKDSLEMRKLLDRAKGILMSTHNLTEEESYRRIQRYAMMKRMTIKEVAEAVLKAAKK